jgi:sulfur carrier protein ThiS
MEIIEVTVGRFPGRLATIGLNGGHTVADALREAELTVSPGWELLVNGEPARPEQTLSDGDRVLLTRQVKGN